jgi:presenilin-like A22 family membrane protease
MKHTLKITAVLLVMFVLTQFIGLYVINSYLPEEKPLPFGLDTPQIEDEAEYYGFFSYIIIAFIIAIVILFFLTKFNAEFILKIWFFIVVILALTISLTAIIPEFNYLLVLSLTLAVILAFFKIYRTNFIVHNATELLIYPGIAAVFVPILNIWTIGGLLILISIYDIWAVWHSGIMQKMAKYQIDKLKIFSGFFIPYLSREVRKKIKKMKKTLKKSELKKKKIKINVAILGGGDVVFPIIAAGVMLKTLGLGPALLVIAGATLGLTYLFFFAEKKKFYPAMPFITGGILLGVLLSYLIF